MVHIVLYLYDIPQSSSYPGALSSTSMLYLVPLSSSYSTSTSLLLTVWYNYSTGAGSNAEGSANTAYEAWDSYGGWSYDSNYGSKAPRAHAGKGAKPRSQKDGWTGTANPMYIHKERWEPLLNLSFFL